MSVNIPSTFGSGGANSLNPAGQPETSRYFGKYRGKVFDNADVLYLGRLRAIVPAVASAPLTWALPCVPFAGPGVGFYAIPPLDANVWIEFEGGDVNKPIWTGCFWEEGQLPLFAPPRGAIVLKTRGVTLMINDVPDPSPGPGSVLPEILPGAGGITLEIAPPATDALTSITIDTAGVQIVSDTLTVTTETSVDVTSSTVTIGDGVVTITGSGTTITGEALTIAGGTTNVLSEAATSIDGPALSITGGVTSIECGDTNIIGAVSIEGVVSVEGEIFVDEMPVAVIPIP